MVLKDYKVLAKALRIARENSVVDNKGTDETTAVDKVISVICIEFKKYSSSFNETRFVQSILKGE